MNRLIALLLLLMAPLNSGALEVFVCEPEWASLVKELAGENANITVATTALQDPHRLQARPSLIAATRRADLLICTGANLEIGWLPLLLRRAGNPTIQPGRSGHFMAANYVRKLEIPASVDRSQGDVHPQGNPHIHLNPNNIARIAKKLAQRLSQLDSVNQNNYSDRLQSFQSRWETATMSWEQRGEILNGLRLVSHHRAFSYLADWLDLDIVATLERKPGIPPSASHLVSLIELLSPNPPAAVVRAPYANEKPSLWLTERLDIRLLRLPYTVNETDGPVDLFELFDMTLAALEEANDERR
ncbi:MAG: zinc ABC transporter substrate-binding protein [Gammaproteobacteria bacterium]|nr:zinc ABC transporter substrate-binding protein [Gammaproteobacteria bacterium]